MYDTIIIGSGPAGLTAAIYNVRADLKTVVIAGQTPGGQLTITTVVENFPGFPNGIGGVKLMMDTMEQVKNLGVEIMYDYVEKVEKTGNKFRVILRGGRTLVTKAVIVATGAKTKWLGLPKEEELIGKGVSGCATCDGMFYRDRVVAVVGGGNTACGEADFLSRITPKVYLIHRREELRASAVEQEKVKRNPKIEILWNTEVKELVADEGKLKAIKVVNNKTGEEKEIEIDGLFEAVGNTPATEFVADMVETKDSGHIVTGKNSDYPTMASVEGIFAAGDCADEVYRQAIISAGTGAKAAIDVERWLSEKRLTEEARCD